MNKHSRHLQNKTAFITGGGKGIGKAIACKLAEHGATLIIHHNHSEEEAEATCSEIRNAEGKAHRVKADFTQTKEIKKMFAEGIAPLLGENGKLDILVNNAGVCERSYLQSFTDEQFEKIMSVNFRTPMYIIREALTMFNSHGRIINISSMMAKDPDSKYLLYAASKAALNTLTLSLSFDLGK